MSENDIELFINTATKKCAFGLNSSRGFFKAELTDCKRTLEDGIVVLKKLLDENGFCLKDVTAFYCLLGPGSNTGIRLGLTIPRTIRAVNDQVKLFGINTLSLLLKKAPQAVLSDRSSNLFCGRKDGQFKVFKDDLSPLLDELTAVEESDIPALSLLDERRVVKVDVLSCMLENKDAFEDFSSCEERYLPQYLNEL